MRVKVTVASEAEMERNEALVLTGRTRGPSAFCAFVRSIHGFLDASLAVPDRDACVRLAVTDLRIELAIRAVEEQKESPMSDKVTRFPSEAERREREQDRRDTEEALWLARLEAGDPVAREWWLNHEVELPFGVWKRYGDLTRAEVQLVVEMDRRKAKAAADKLDRGLDEIERRVRAGDPDAIAVWDEPEFVAARAKRDARKAAR